MFQTVRIVHFKRQNPSQHSTHSMLLSIPNVAWVFAWLCCIYAELQLNHTVQSSHHLQHHLVITSDDSHHHHYNHHHHHHHHRCYYHNFLYYNATYHFIIFIVNTILSSTPSHSIKHLRIISSKVQSTTATCLLPGRYQWTLSRRKNFEINVFVLRLLKVHLHRFQHP